MEFCLLFACLTIRKWYGVSTVKKACLKVQAVSVFIMLGKLDLTSQEKWIGTLSLTCSVTLCRSHHLSGFLFLRV